MPYVRSRGGGRPRTPDGRADTARFGLACTRHAARDAEQGLTELGDQLITMQAAVQRAATAGRTAGRAWLRVRNGLTGVMQNLDAFEAEILPLLTPQVTA